MRGTVSVSLILSLPGTYGSKGNLWMMLAALQLSAATHDRQMVRQGTGTIINVRSIFEQRRRTHTAST